MVVWHLLLSGAILPVIWYGVVCMEDEVEIWKPIPFAPHYEVSNLNRVRCWRSVGCTKKRLNKPRLRKLTTRGTTSYVNLRNELGIHKTYTVRKLKELAWQTS